MHCAACAELIEALLLRQPGVRFARVSAASEHAELRWDGAQTNREHWLAALRGAGYDAVPVGAEAQQLQRRREARQALWRLFVAGLCLSQVMMYTAPLYLAAPGEIEASLVHLLQWAAWLLTLPVLLFSAAPLFQGAWRGVRMRRIGMDLPVALGLALAYAASTVALFDPGGPLGVAFGGEIWFDSITMFVCFLLLARWLEMRLRHRSADALHAGHDAWPAQAQRLVADDEVRTVPTTSLQPGDLVRVATGEAFPADGVLVRGDTRVSEAWLSGESRPLPRQPGDEVAAGSLNLQAPVDLRVQRVGEQTRAAAVLALMRQALTQRPAVLRLADRIAAPFLWAVLLLAAAAAAAWSVVDPARALPVAVAVLIVTCPCALSLAGPSALIAAAGALARRGLLLRRIDALEALAAADALVFDKTGTLTHERMSFERLRPSALAGDWSADALLQHAAGLARHSHHPVAQAIAAAVPVADTGDGEPWSDVHEQPGAGLSGRDRLGRVWALGSSAWVLGTTAPGEDGARAWLACDGRCLASLDVQEALRDDAALTVQALAADGLALSVLSGDAPERVARVAERLAIPHARGGATPHDKLQALSAAQAQGHRVAMVGDGLNDAPVLARADVSFSFANASAVSRARADAVLLGSSLAVVAEAHRHARRTMRVLRQNMAWSAAYNLACVPLALAGWLPPWAAGIGMAASSLLVVLNSQRLRHVQPLQGTR